MTYQKALEKLCKMSEDCGIKGCVSVGINRFRFTSGKIETVMDGYIDMQTGNTDDNIYFRGSTFESVLNQIAVKLEEIYTPKVA